MLEKEGILPVNGVNLSAFREPELFIREKATSWVMF
jgi:hypothetical protein